MIFFGKTIAKSEGKPPENGATSHWKTHRKPVGNQMNAQRKTWLENARKHARKCHEECGKMPGNMLANTRKNAENY